MYRLRESTVEVLLVHPGGPLWAKKDAGAWTIPKGEYEDHEDPLAAAKREFEEETGMRPEPEFLPLGEVRQAGGKIVQAWAFQGDCEVSTIRSNTFTIEWPPRSGRQRKFPEIDRAEWFDLIQASSKLIPAQTAFLERLAAALAFNA